MIRSKKISYAEFVELGNVQEKSILDRASVSHRLEYDDKNKSFALSIRLRLWAYLLLIVPVNVIEIFEGIFLYGLRNIRFHFKRDWHHFFVYRQNDVESYNKCKAKWEEK